MQIDKIFEGGWIYLLSETLPSFFPALFPKWVLEF